VEVTLGGQAYMIEELKVRQNAAWRKQLSAPFADLADLLAKAPRLELDAGEAASLLKLVKRVLAESIATVQELLFAYAPALAADRERIEAEAYDSEILEAFTRVLGLAYPFGLLLEKVAGVSASGSPHGATSPN
jgi:hypothetical protein